LTDPRLADRQPLEPWALDLLSQDRAGKPSDPDAQEELARLVSLLRRLPDPEPSPDLAGRVLDYVAEQRSRRRVVSMAFGVARRLASPSVALPLAAAVATLLAITVSPGSLPSILRSGDAAVEVDTIESNAAAERPNPIRRSTIVIRPQFVSAVFAQAPAASPRMRLDRAPLEEAFDQRLDRQLNQLMIDPTAFAQRLERVAQRDRFIARLAERAAERGDAPEIALRVRQSPHPLASQLVDRLLRATLVASISPR
jgi:hypothetical protein